MSTKKTKPKKYSWKIWVAFWLASIIFLFGWFVFLQIENRKIENLKPFLKILPIGEENREKMAVFADIFQKGGGWQNEKTYLILLQNDLELRPGGGFIGAFGIFKTKNGKISHIEVHDTGNFDARVPNNQIPPAALAENLGIKAWKMRDSNWSPDFRENARKAEEFYILGGGGERFDGILAVNSGVLDSILEITGPVKIDDYPGEYRDETAVLQLEYQVEKGYALQGIEKRERKNIMGELADVLAEKIHAMNLKQQIALARKLEKHLESKDIQLFFKDESLQKSIEEIGWSGKIYSVDGDFLMAVDANLRALKSDFCIRRKMDYAVDFSRSNPQAVLNLTYEHTCRAKDWMVSDYRSWLRIFTPKGSFLEELTGEDGNPVFSDELGKKVFGMRIYVPVGETKTVTLKYRLPANFDEKSYRILVQKQSGSGDVPFSISVRHSDGRESFRNLVLTRDENIEL